MHKLDMESCQKRNILMIIRTIKKKKRDQNVNPISKKEKKRTVEEIIPKWNKEITGQKREDSRKKENKVMSIREKNRKGSGCYAKFPP